MYKISREEIAEIKAPRIFSVIAYLFKMLCTTAILGAISGISWLTYVGFYGSKYGFYSEPLIVQQWLGFSGFVFGMSLLAMVPLGLVWIIAGLWSPLPATYFGQPDMSGLKLVRVEDGPWGRKYIYESDKELY